MSCLLQVIIGAWHPDYTSYYTDWHVVRVLYVLLLVTSTLYSWSWDIFMDWGYFTRDAEGNWVPRPIVFERARTFNVVADLIGRSAWAYTLIVKPPGIGAKAKGCGRLVSRKNEPRIFRKNNNFRAVRFLSFFCSFF